MARLLGLRKKPQTSTIDISNCGLSLATNGWFEGLAMLCCDFATRCAHYNVHSSLQLLENSLGCRGEGGVQIPKRPHHTAPSHLANKHLSEQFEVRTVRLTRCGVIYGTATRRARLVEALWRVGVGTEGLVARLNAITGFTHEHACIHGVSITTSA